MNQRPALILSALGEKSFRPAQLLQLRKAHETTFRSHLKPVSAARFAALARPFEILGLTRRAVAVIDESLLDRLPRLRGLAVYATGLDWIDLEACCARGIRVEGLPDYSARTVAEHALGSLLTLSRRLHLSHDKMQGRVPASTSLRGWEIKGKKLGVIGLGRVGAETARLAQALGMKVRYCDIRQRSSALRRQSLKSMLAGADAIVLAASRNFGDPPLLGMDELALLQKHSVLVNVARESLVDNQAVLRLLRQRRFAGYAVDDAVASLLRAKGIEPGRLLQTGHTAWYSNEAMARGTLQWTQALIRLGRAA